MDAADASPHRRYAAPCAAVTRPLPPKPTANPRPLLWTAAPNDVQGRVLRRRWGLRRSSRPHGMRLSRTPGGIRRRPPPACRSCPGRTPTTTRCPVPPADIARRAAEADVPRRPGRGGQEGASERAALQDVPRPIELAACPYRRPRSRSRRLRAARRRVSSSARQGPPGRRRSARHGLRWGTQRHGGGIYTRGKDSPPRYPPVRRADA